MKASYDRWRKRLAGEKVVLHELPEPEDCGFYRMPIRERQPLKNGQGTKSKIVGWERAALMVHEGEIVGVIGTSMLRGDELAEKWLWLAPHPIREEWYRARERGEPWPDSHETVVSIPVANSSSVVDAMVKDREQSLDVIAADVLADAAISAKIDKAAAQLAKFATIDSDEMSSKARSLQQQFLDLRGEAKKHYDELNDPLLAEQKRIRAIWFPLRDRADEAAGKLRDAMGAWETEKRKAARLAQEAADRAAREHAEAARKAAEANQPAPPAPEPIKTNIPASASQIKGGGGRAASVRVEMVVTAIDVEKVFAQFKNDPRVVGFLTDLAQKAIRAGIAVPGAVCEEKSVVR